MAAGVGAALTAVVLAAIGCAMVYPVDDLDVWWLLRSGAYMVETRSFPTTDPFSWPAFGAEWINHAWAFQLLLYAVHRVGGTTGLILLQALFAAATFAVLLAILRREGTPRAGALVATAAGGLATWGFWAPRPQIVTYLALASVWAILRAWRDGRADRLMWLPPLTLVWANLHGGFMVGPALIGLVLVGEIVERSFRGLADPAAVRPRLGRLGLALVASLVASFATPFGYRAVLFPFQVLGDRFAQAFIIEWASPGFQHGQVRMVEGLVLLTLALLALAPRRVPATDLIVLAAFLHFGLQAIRNLPLLVIVLLPILGRALAEVLAERAPGWVARSGVSPRRFGLVAGALALVLAGWWLLPARAPRTVLPRFGVADVFPAGAVEFLKRARPPGPLFNDYGWGGYLIWHLYPDYRVSIDGRAAVHGPRRFAEHIQVADVRPRWRETLERLGPRLVLVSARSPLAIVLRASPDWQVLYEDRIAVVLGRREASR
jgi:hypothetical protein